MVIKDRPDNIKNELVYFYKVIKNMDSKDNIKNSKIREYEIPLKEIIYDSFLDDFDMDKQVVEKVYLVG